MRYIHLKNWQDKSAKYPNIGIEYRKAVIQDARPKTVQLDLTVLEICNPMTSNSQPN